MSFKMPCNCTGLQTKRCNCTVIGYPLKSTSRQSRLTPFPTQFIVGQLDRDTHFETCSNHQATTKNILLRITEGIYDRCAAYNLRYCPFRRNLYNDKHVTRAAKDIINIMCFLLANLVVFLNITAITLIHLAVLIKEIGCGVKKFLCSSETSIPIHFTQEGTSIRHDLSPERNNFINYDQ